MGPGLILVVLCAGSVLASLNSLVVGPLLPVIARDLQVSVPAAGQLAAAAALPTVLLALGAGPLSDRLGRRRLLIAGLWMLSATYLVSAATPSYGLMLVIRTLGGVGAAALSVSLAAVGDYFPPQRRGAAVGFMVGLSATAGTLFVPLTGALAELAGWRTALGALGALAAAASLFARQLPPSASQPAPAPLRLPAGTGWYYLCQVLGSSQYNGTFTYFGAFLASTYGLGPGAVSLLYGLGGLGFFLGSVLAGRLVPPRARLWFIAGAGAGTILPLALLFGAPRHLGLTMALLVAFTLVRGGIVSSLYGATGDLDPRRRGTLLSLAQAASQLGIWLGATAGGAAVAQGGYTLLTATMCALALAAALSALAASRQRSAPMHRV